LIDGVNDQAAMPGQKPQPCGIRRNTASNAPIKNETFG
jgi:hypothetical protein